MTGDNSNEAGLDTYEKLGSENWNKLGSDICDKFWCDTSDQLGVILMLSSKSTPVTSYEVTPMII